MSEGPCWPIDTTYFIDDFHGLEPRFVFRVLQVLGLLELDTSSAIPGLNRNDVYAKFLAVPPVAEQKRIVAKVDELLAAANATRERLARVPAILKRFHQAVLAAACSGRLTEDWRDAHEEAEPASCVLNRITAIRAASEKRGRRSLRPQGTGLDSEAVDGEGGELPRNWAWATLDQIATVCLGGTPSRKDASLWGGSIPWVSSGEVANCRITGTRERISEKGLAQSNAKPYPKGTVLIAMIGEGKTRGQTALLEIEACTNQNVAALVFDAGNVEPEYIWLWARGEYERHRSGGRGGNYPALNGAIVRAFRVPFAPLAEQREIVRRVEALFRLAEAIEKRVAAATRRTEGLTQAILAKAFRGELVPTEAELARREGRDYEPASALLERIQAERARTRGGGSVPRRRRRQERRAER